MESLVGIVIFAAVIAVLAGVRRRGAEATGRPAVMPGDGPRHDPWPHPIVPGLIVQPDANCTLLRIVLEALKERWRTKLSPAGSPDAIAHVLLDMAALGGRNCSRARVPDLGRRFEVLRDRLVSQRGGERGITQTEAQAALEEMKLLLGTVSAIASRRYVG